jgi:leucyl/phenylalanyl-tRNA---protein transferase
MAPEPQFFDELFVPIDARPRALPPNIELAPSRFFPPPTSTTPDGLLCIGGRLSPEWLIDAYRHGIFPWPMWEDEPVAWWSPDPRAVIELDGLHVSRRLGRTIRSRRFRVTFDQDFAGVIHGCATAGDRQGNTWLTPAMIAAYCRMHQLGHAHSVEVWLDPPLPLGEGLGVRVPCSSDERLKTPSPGSPSKPPSPEGRGKLVGGTYGIAIGGLFAAESMFHRARDASKIAVASLVERLRACGYQLLDIQQWTPHTGRMGAVEISREDYLRRIARAVELPVKFGVIADGSNAPNDQ